MNEFVNFGKRSVVLPAGCKDLIEVLQQSKRHPTPAWSVCPVEGLGDVGKHLHGLLELGAKSKYLAVSWHEMNYNHILLMNEDGVLSSLMVIHEDNHREQAVRGVFSAAGLGPIRDEAVAGWSVRVLKYPLPDAVSRIEELISDLLRTGFGLAENARLEFASWEGEVC
jgi:hypothetical protein